MKCPDFKKKTLRPARGRVRPSFFWYVLEYAAHRGTDAAHGGTDAAHRGTDAVHRGTDAAHTTNEILYTQIMYARVCRAEKSEKKINSLQIIEYQLFTANQKK